MIEILLQSGNVPCTSISIPNAAMDRIYIHIYIYIYIYIYIHIYISKDIINFVGSIPKRILQKKGKMFYIFSQKREKNERIFFYIKKRKEEKMFYIFIN